MQQVMSEERSLAAAMRWQDELTSRGCLPAPERVPTPLLGLASLDPGQLASLQRSDSRLLSVAAAAQARISGPVNNSTPAQPLAASASDTTGAASQDELYDGVAHEQDAVLVQILHTSGNSQATEQQVSPYLPVTAPEASGPASSGKAVPTGLEHGYRDAAHEHAHLARLPSAKGHCLSSYPTGILGRPQSPMKHSSASANVLGGGLPTAGLLSVKPVSMQGHRPATAAAAAAAADCVVSTSGAQETGDSLPQSSAGHPVVLERSTRPIVKAASTTELDALPGTEDRQSTDADDSPLPGAWSNRQQQCGDASDQQLGISVSSRNLHKPPLGVPAASTQHAIPERLLTSRQAAALLSGIPPNMRAARMKQRESFLQPADPVPSMEYGELTSVPGTSLASAHHHLCTACLNLFAMYNYAAVCIITG